MSDETAWEGDVNGVVAEGQPSDSEHSENHVKDEPIAEDHALRASPPSATAVSDGAAYDPLSVVSHTTAALTNQDTSRSSSRTSTRKPRTVGGFIAESDEEGDDTPDSSARDLLQPPPADQAASRSPLSNAPLTSHHTAEMSPYGRSAPNDTITTIAVDQNGGPKSTPTPVSVPGSQPFAPKARLPHDTVGMLEDRIKEDPRGDLDAWRALIDEHQKRNKLEDARAVYDRFFKVFPSAAEMWVSYAEMELSNDNFYAAEQIFGRVLLSVPNVRLWSVYMDYIRRRNDLTNDPTGTARKTISDAFEFVLSNVGIDRDSGKLWQEYLEFIRTSPGQVGGSSWQDQQKMDRLRKAYQRAICVPMSAVNNLWKEYDQFEMGLNKATGRKFLQERSPAYMSARSANTALENITRGLDRISVSRLPPALGFEGDQEYIQQVDLWKRWVMWELEDPLVLKQDEPETYNKRVLYVYKQAVMSLRFWPEMWVEAADWCFANGQEKEGNEFLSQGITANPESCLLAFKQADRLEYVLPIEEGDEGLASRGAAVRAPYDKLLDALYEHGKKLKARESAAVARLESMAPSHAIPQPQVDNDDEDEDAETKDKAVKEALERQIAAVKQGYDIQSKLLSKAITFSWIALMRAMRRVQGKGRPGTAVAGARGILQESRAKGRLTSDIYVAAALIEWNVYRDPVGTKIFERGSRLFPEDENYILEYLKHLLSIGDITNARAVFETSVNRLTQKPENIPKTKVLYSYFHKYEAEYGDHSQILKLERRMADLFPDDPKLNWFSSRYTFTGFDPCAVRPIISPTSQMRPKLIMQSIERPMSIAPSEVAPLPVRQENSPRPFYPVVQPTNSPKRPLDDSDNELNRPRKLARGESPLKGAAGRRLDQQKRLQQQTHGTTSWQTSTTPAVPIPRDITFLLSIIPRAEFYNATRFNAEAMVRLLQQTTIPDYGTWKAAKDQPRYDGGYQYGR